MKISRLYLKGLPAFPGAIDLQLGALEPGLLAIVGRNGKGKTTIMEAPAAATYRHCPSRDINIVELARERDSQVILEYETDARYRATLSLDSQTRNTDALLEELLPGGGTRRINNGQRSTFDAAIKQRFPSLDVFRYSVFAPQGQGDAFDRAKPAEKKTVFAEFLGLGAYQVRSAAADGAAKTCEAERNRLITARDLVARDADPSIAAQLDADANAWQEKGGAAEVRKRELHTAIADIETRQASLADSVAAYHLAVSRFNALTEEERQLAANVLELDRLHAGVATALNTEIHAIESRRDMQLRELANKIAANEGVLSKAEAIRAAVAKVKYLDGCLDAYRKDLQTFQDAYNRHRTDLAVAEQSVAAFIAPQRDLERAEQDSKLLTLVPCAGAGEYAACDLLKNAQRAAAQVATLTTTLAGLTAAVQDRDRLTAAVAEAQDGLTHTRASIAALDKERTPLADTASYETALSIAETRIEEYREKERDVTAESERQAAEARARAAARADELGARLLVVRTAHDAATDKLTTARHDLEAVEQGNSQAAALAEQLAGARAEWDSVTHTLAAATHAHADIQRRREAHAAKLAELDVLEQQIELVTTELLDWRGLAKDLGRGGLPDLEIDHAGPDISARANALMTACFGPRFTLQLVTQVPKADGGMKDEFTVQVLDNEDPRGDWRPLSTLSGGEKVIVQEALMLAISIHVNERSEHPIRTLFRDETGSALDDENALLYVEMLRKAREIGGFESVWFITHNLAAAALADAQIRVGNGTATLVVAPFSEAA